MFSLPESLRLYHRVLVNEFLREWHFLMDVLAKRSQSREDFADKLVSHFKNLISLGIGQLPLPAKDLFAASFGIAIDWVNGKRKEAKHEHFGKLQWEVDETELRIFIEAAALEACRRHQYVILTQLVDDPLKGVVPLAKAGVERMLEYIGRNDLPVTVENLVNGLIAGHSGAYITNYTNTQLTPRDKKKSDSTQPRHLFGHTGYTAEGVYGRSGLMMKTGELYALIDKRQARHKMQRKKGYKEALFNYGYTHLEKNTEDPKYGYLYVSSRVVDQLYEHLKDSSYFQKLQQNKEKLTPALQQQLKDFKPAIIVIDKKDLMAYLAATKEIVEAKIPHDRASTKESLLDFIRRTKSDAGAVQFVLYDPEDLNDRDLTEFNFAGLNLDDCGFMNCQFGQSLQATTFRRSALQFGDLTKVTTAEEADFSEAHCEYVKAKQLNLTQAKLNQTNCGYADFSETTMVQTQTLGTDWYQTNLTQIRTENAAEKQAIESAQEQRQKMVIAQHQQLEQLQQQLKSQQEKLHTLQVQIDRLSKHSEQNENIKTLTKMLQALYQEQQSRLAFEHSTRAELIRIQTVQTLQGKTLAHYANQLHQLQMQIKALENEHVEFNKLAQETHQLADTVLQQQGQIHDLAQQLNIIGERYREIAQRQMAHAQQMFALERRASILQHSVTDLQQQILHAVITDEKLDQLKNQAQEILKQCYRGFNEIRGLFGKPFQLEGYINLQMLYKVDLKEEKKEQQDEKKADDGNKKWQDKRISSYEDLFGDKRTIKLQDLFKPDKELFSSEQIKDQKQADKVPIFLLIQGRAGIGKTTFVHYAARQWVKGQVGFLQYEWVFTLTLRELRSPVFKELLTQGKQLPLWLWVYHAQFKTSSLSEYDFGLIWQRRIEPSLKDNKVLLILDGFDEVPDHHPCEGALKALLEGQYAHITKIITSRPYGVNHLPQARRDIEIIGFTDQNIERYVKTYFSEEKEDFIFKFIKNLKDQPTLWGCVHIPVNLNLLCGIADGAAKQSHHALQRELEQLYSMTSTYEAMECKLYERTYIERPNADHRLPSLPAVRKQFLLKHYQIERHFLAKLAFLGMQKQQIILPRMHINQLLLELFTATPTINDVSFMQNVCDLGLIKPVIKMAYISEEEQSYEFIHLTFQEYYTAVHIVEILFSQDNHQRNIAETVILQEKLNSRWQIVWWFVAGLLKEEPKKFASFINLLEGRISHSNQVVNVPIAGDLLRHYELGLLVRCAEEGYNEQNEACIAPIRERVQRFMAHIYELFRKDLLSDNFQPPLFASLQLSPHFCHAADELDIYAKISETEKSELLRFAKVIAVNSPKIISMHLLIDPKKQQDEQQIPEEITFLKKINAEIINDEILNRLALLLIDDEWQYDALKTVQNLGLVAAKPAVIKNLALLLKSDQTRSWSVICLFKIFLVFGNLALTSDMIDAFSSWLMHANGWTDEMMLWISNVKAGLATPAVLEQLGSVLLKKWEQIEQPVKQISIAKLIGSAAITTTLLESSIGNSTEENNKFLCYLAIKGFTAEAVLVATPDVLQHLAKLLLSANRQTVLKAIKTVAFMGPVAATPIICQRLAMIMVGMDEELRLAVCDAVMILGTVVLIPEFLKPLMGLLVDEKIVSVIAVYFISSPNFLERLIVFAKDALHECDIYLTLVREIKERLGGHDDLLPSSYYSLISSLPTNSLRQKELLHYHSSRVASWALNYYNVKPVSAEKIKSALANPTLLKRYEDLLADINNVVLNKTLDIINALEPRLITTIVLNRLALLITNTNSTLAEHALTQIARIGDSAVTQACKDVINLLTDDDTQESGIYGVQRLGASRSVELGIDIPNNFIEHLCHFMADQDNFKASSLIVSSINNDLKVRVIDGLIKLLVNEKEQIQKFDMVVSLFPHSLPQIILVYTKKLFSDEIFERFLISIMEGKLSRELMLQIMKDTNHLPLSRRLHKHLEVLLKDDNEKLRETAISMIGDMPFFELPVFLDSLVRQLEDKSEKIFLAAKVVLKKIGAAAITSEAVMYFIALMNGKNKKQQIAAIEIVGNMDPNTIFTEVINCFEMLLNGNDNSIHEYLLESIDKIGVSAVTPFIFERLIILSLGRGSFLERQRQYTENILKKIALLGFVDPLFIERLINLLRSDTFLHNALLAINILGSQVITPGIFKELINLIAKGAREYSEYIESIGLVSKKTTLAFEIFKELINLKNKGVLEHREYLKPIGLALQKATLTFLISLYELFTDKDIPNKNITILFLNLIIKLRYVSLLTEWIGFCRTPDSITPMLPALHALFFGAYLSGNINCCVIWNEASKNYFIQGFADSVPYQFPISMVQAHVLRHLLPIILDQLNTEKFLAMEIVITQMQQWLQMDNDPLLADSRVDAAKSSSTEEKATVGISISSLSSMSFFSASASTSSVSQPISAQQLPLSNMPVNSSTFAWKTFFTDLQKNEQFNLLFQSHTLLTLNQSPQNTKEVIIQPENKAEPTHANQLKLLGNKFEDHCPELKEKDFRKGVLTLRFKNSSDADDFIEFVQNPDSGLHFVNTGISLQL